MRNTARRIWYATKRRQKTGEGRAASRRKLLSFPLKHNNDERNDEGAVTLLKLEQ